MNCSIKNRNFQKLPVLAFVCGKPRLPVVYESLQLTKKLLNLRRDSPGLRKGMEFLSITLIFFCYCNYHSNCYLYHHKFNSLKQHPCIISQFCTKSPHSVAQLSPLSRASQGQNQSVSWAGLFSGGAARIQLPRSYRLSEDFNSFWL